MAYITQTHSTTLSTIWEKISDVFSMIGRGIIASSAMDERMKRVDALKAKTDEELAAMKLRRMDIPAHVFRDLMHL